MFMLILTGMLSFSLGSPLVWFMRLLEVLGVIQ